MIRSGSRMADETGKNGTNGPVADLSWNDWEERTEQREAPSTELLDAMKHPDVPGVVLEAIARRSSQPPAHEAPPREEESTNRYVLPPGAPLAARLAEAASVPPRVHYRAEREEGLAGAVVLAFAMGGVVIAWLSFGLLVR